MQIAFPFSLDQDGDVASADPDAHIRQMIEQVLFTNPGERVNRPEFGCGLATMVFEPLSGEMVAVTQALVGANLVRWLGDLIQVEHLAVQAVDARLEVIVHYVVLATGARQRGTFST
jgi:phage baseplate assembly protein W